MIQFNGPNNELQKKYTKMKYYNTIVYDEGYVYPNTIKINKDMDSMHYKGFLLNKETVQKLVKT